MIVPEKSTPETRKPASEVSKEHPHIDEALVVLRGPEESRRVASETKDWPKYERAFRDPRTSAEVVTYGDGHYYDETSAKGLEAAFAAAKPEVVLVEGDTVNTEFDPEMTGADILKKYGEQGYMVWMAKKNGVEVRSWDTPFEDRIEDVVAEHEPEAIVGWFIGQASKHLRSKGAEITPDNMLKMLANVAPKALMKMVEHDLPLTDADFERVSKRLTGKSLKEIDANDSEALVSKGPSGRVLEAMNAARDAHAVRTIGQEMQSGKKVFVTAGSSHVVSWEPALMKLQAV